MCARATQWYLTGSVSVSAGWSDTEGTAFTLDMNATTLQQASASLSPPAVNLVRPSYLGYIDPVVTAAPASPDLALASEKLFAYPDYRLQHVSWPGVATGEYSYFATIDTGGGPVPTLHSGLSFVMQRWQLPHAEPVFGEYEDAGCLVAAHPFRVGGAHFIPVDFTAVFGYSTGTRIDAGMGVHYGTTPMAVLHLDTLFLTTNKRAFMAECGTLTVRYYHPTGTLVSIALPLYAYEPMGTGATPAGRSVTSYSATATLTLDVIGALPYGHDPDAPAAFTTLNPLWDPATGQPV